MSFSRLCRKMISAPLPYVTRGQAASVSIRCRPPIAAIFPGPRSLHSIASSDSCKLQAAVAVPSLNRQQVQLKPASLATVKEVSAGNEASQGNETPSKVTIIAFDIETTGFRTSEDRILEFAAADLAGGKNCSMSTLVNPGRRVPYIITKITGITNAMVNKPQIPSWNQVGPVVLEFIESRRQGNGPVILAGHNSKRFDAPFLLREFLDSSIELPDWLLFLDTLPLAREVKKNLGYEWPSCRLSEVYKAYGFEMKEKAHRAMADVNMLSSVLGMVLRDLQMEPETIVERCFSACDVYMTNKAFQDRVIHNLIGKLCSRKWTG